MIAEAERRHTETMERFYWTEQEMYLKQTITKYTQNLPLIQTTEMFICIFRVLFQFLS